MEGGREGGRGRRESGDAGLARLWLRAWSPLWVRQLRGSDPRRPPAGRRFLKLIGRGKKVDGERGREKRKKKKMEPSAQSEGR